MTTDLRRGRPSAAITPWFVTPPETNGTSGFELLLQRVRREYEEMPGMSLNVHQAGRLFGMPEDVCRLVFEGLVERGVLRRLRDARYVINRQTA